MKKFAPSRSNMRTPKQQRGVGTLVISLILLISMTLIAFFANKSLLFEQKTSANQMRSTTAFEAAEAGLEWEPQCLTMCDTSIQIAPRSAQIPSHFALSTCPTAPQQVSHQCQLRSLVAA